MRRDGSYAIYNGKEYSLGFNFKPDGTEEFELSSRDSQDVNNGFIKDEKRDIYRKKITLEELEAAYSVYTWCKYKGYEFQVLAYSEKDDTYDIECNWFETCSVKELGFTLRNVESRKKVKEKSLTVYTRLSHLYLDLNKRRGSSLPQLHDAVSGFFYRKI